MRTTTRPPEARPADHADNLDDLVVDVVWVGPHVRPAVEITRDREVWAVLYTVDAASFAAKILAATRAATGTDGWGRRRRVAPPRWVYEDKEDTDDT